MAPEVLETHDVIFQIRFLGVSLTRYWKINVIAVLLRQNWYISMHFSFKKSISKFDLIWPQVDLLWGQVVKITAIIEIYVQNNPYKMCRMT